MNNKQNAGGKAKKKAKRSILTFEPCGPVLSMVANELKTHTRPGHKPPRGALVKLLEVCVVNALGQKYPKLLSHYQILKEEGH